MSGNILGINPFDQPGVEKYKENMFRLLGKYEYQGAISKNVEFDYFPFEVKNKERMAIEIVNEIAPNVEDWEIIRELNLLNTDTEVLYRSFNLLSGGEQIKILLISLFLNLSRVEMMILLLSISLVIVSEMSLQIIWILKHEII